MSNLLKDNKKLMEEYNHKKNKDLILDKITLGSSKKIWWKCSKCNYEWEATPKNRYKGGTDCPICGLEKIEINHNKSILAKRGSLNDNRPDIAKEWDYDKNYPLTPKDVSIGSGKKVWWKCEKGHSWEASIHHRTSGSGCIYCAKQKSIPGENDITTTNPELMQEWDYDKNIGINPKKYMSWSKQKVWWKCQLGHSWQASISKRNSGTGCPYCYTEYGTSFPEQAILFYISKVTKAESRKKVNGQEIDIFLPDLKIGFEYDGSYYHNDDNSLTKEKKKNDIIEKNGISLYHIKESSENKIDKKNKTIFCLIDREYKYIEQILTYIQDIIKMEINDVNIERDRITIYNQYVKAIKDNNFTIAHPELLKEWDYEKNKGLSPEFFSQGSNKKVWWKCSKCGSSFLTSISKRIGYSNCPYCSAKKVNDTNSLESKYPNLMKYWNYDLNKELSPSNLYYSSRAIAWWICEKCNQPYRMSICSRIKSKTNYCPNCMHKHIGNNNRIKSFNEENSLSKRRPDLANEWIYEKNYPLTPKDVTIGSGKKVWWKCSKCSNEWQSTIYNRTNGTGCPKCNINGSKNTKK